MKPASKPEKTPDKTPYPGNSEKLRNEIKRIVNEPAFRESLKKGEDFIKKYVDIKKSEIF